MFGVCLTMNYGLELITQLGRLPLGPNPFLNNLLTVIRAFTSDNPNANWIII
jgi:hypothetical protein